MRQARMEDMSFIHFPNDLLITSRLFDSVRKLLSINNIYAIKLGYSTDFQYLYMAKHKDKNHVEIP